MDNMDNRDNHAAKKRKYECDGESCRLVDGDDSSTSSNCTDGSQNLSDVSEDISESNNLDNLDNDTVFPFPKSSDEWTVYGASWCNYCQISKNKLEEKGFEVVYHDVEKIPTQLDDQTDDQPDDQPNDQSNNSSFYTTQQVKNILGSKTNNYNTIPMIFYYGNFIGGYKELCGIIGS
jgi:glutaredoxin